MLEVRRVRVGDIKLTDLFRRRTLTDAEVKQYRDTHSDQPRISADGQKWIADREEGVLMKAAAEDAEFRVADRPKDIDWASLHMNLSIQNAVAPGAELLMAVADEPPPAEGNMFSGQLGHPTIHGAPNFSMEGYVNIPKDDDLFSFVITPDGGGDTYEVRFHGYQADRFIRALLFWWFSRSPIQEGASKVFAIDKDGVCEVGNAPVDTGHTSPDND